MLTRNSAGVAHRDDADARKIDQLGGTVNFLATLNHKPFQAIHVELVGSTQCAAEGITANSSSPVLELCGLLLAAGDDPDRPLEAWRGDTLCLRIRSIAGVRGCAWRPMGRVSNAALNAQQPHPCVQTDGGLHDLNGPPATRRPPRGNQCGRALLRGGHG